MKIAVLSQGHSLENFVDNAMVAAGIEATYFRDFDRMLRTLRTSAFEALMVEDDAEYIGGWLATLQLAELPQIPRIVVGAADSSAMSRALQKGAHDYAVLDAGARSLVCRIVARVNAQRELDRARSLQVGSYLLDANTQTLSTDALETSLTAREFALAWMLFENLGRVVSMRVLSAEIWGRSADIGKRTLEQHVYKLRRKMSAGAPEGAMPPHIQAVYGVGYRLQL